MQHPIEWADQPQTIAPGSRLELWRAGVGSTPPVVLLNRRHCGAEIHWFGGRSFPHLGKGCPACEAKRPSVWKGYIGAWNPKTRAIGLIEFTGPCISAFNEYFLKFDTCRGAILTLKRRGMKANGQLQANLSPSTWATNELPAEPDMRQALDHIWFSKPFPFEINLDPGRPYVEPASTTEEVLARRAMTDAALGKPGSEKHLIPLSHAAEMLKEAVREANPSFKKNGSHK